MFKKLILPAMSVAALLAFAAPVAQASGPLITDAKGNAAAEITAESTNTKIVTANGTLECATTKLKAKVTENALTTALGNGTGEGSGTIGKEPHTHCGFGAFAIDNVAIALSKFHLTKHGGETTGTMNFTFTYQMTTPAGTFHCTLADEGGVIVKRTGANTIFVSGNLKKIMPSGVFCPAAGEITGDFKVLDLNKDPVTIH
jgi:hypothetical protein